MAKGLNLSCTPSSAVVSKGGGDFYLLIEVSGGKGAGALPSNIALTLDISDSMRIRLVSTKQFKKLTRSGRVQEVITDGIPTYRFVDVPQEVIDKSTSRLDYVKQALKIASDFLRSSDIFCVVVFASRATMLVPATSGDERSRLYYAAQEIERLHLGNDTQMDEGMFLAFEELRKNVGETYASRMILLTDGHTLNVGDCYRWAELAKEEGIKITTIGIGTEFNEDLLIPLADMTGGNAYYVERADQIPKVFQRELGSAMRVNYRNVEVKLRLEEGIALQRVYRVKPELGPFDAGVEMDHSYSLFIGDYESANPQALLAELRLPALPIGRNRLAQTLLSWEDPEGGVMRQVERSEIFVNVAQESRKANGRVMNLVEKVTAYKLGTQALAAVQNALKTENKEELDAATIRLRQVATRLLNIGESSLAKTMLRQAEHLEEKGDLDAEAAKKLRYETRRLTQRL